jgi:hypothetical protein
MGSTSYGKTAAGVLAGTVGVVILVLFLNMIVLPADSMKFLPFIIAFNTAITGYMVIDKTRDQFRHKRSVAIFAGAASVILASACLNYLFLQATGLFLISLTDLFSMLVIGCVSSWLGGALAIKYLDLQREKQSVEL